MPNCPQVAFKGFHEGIDSLGSFTYPEEPATWKRLTNTATNGKTRLCGCSSMRDWSGAHVLKCSMGGDDVNAPPDVLASHSAKTLGGYLKEQEVQSLAGLCHGKTEAVQELNLGPETL